METIKLAVLQNQTSWDLIQICENRITKLERQVRRIDQRLRKLENSNITTLEEDINDFTNIHMI